MGDISGSDHDISGNEIVCNDGYDVVEKIFEDAIQRSLGLRVNDQNAKNYLIWLHEFLHRRRTFADRLGVKNDKSVNII